MTARANIGSAIAACAAAAAIGLAPSPADAESSVQIGDQAGAQRAQDECAAAHARTAETDDASPNYRVVERDGRQVFVIEQEFVICGRVPRPNVIYVLQASTINYQWEDLQRDFLPKIEGEVREEPF